MLISPRYKFPARSRYPSGIKIVRLKTFLQRRPLTNSPLRAASLVPLRCKQSESAFSNVLFLFRVAFNILILKSSFHPHFTLPQIVSIFLFIRNKYFPENGHKKSPAIAHRAHAQDNRLNSVLPIV
jgi:hypothetical protein